MNDSPPSPDRASEFIRNSRHQRRSLAGEFVGFLAHNKKWWLLPIVVFLGLLGVLMLVGGSSVAPFIYTLF